MLEILDTAGQVRNWDRKMRLADYFQETFSAMRELYMANGEGFALIYSITSSLSFAEVEKIRAGIIKHKNTPSVPMVILFDSVNIFVTLSRFL